jgi:1,4-alpha-glucan branching enzyme
MKRVRFSIEAPGATTVLLSGDFTDWEARARRMRRVRRGSRTFATSVPLDPGTYEYKFLIDGQWVEDPKAESVPNGFGTMNSVRHVAP